MAKRYTVLVIPQGAHRVRRFSLPRIIIPLVALLVLASLGTAGYWFHKYSVLKGDMPDLAKMQDQNQRQDARITHFQNNIEAFKEQLKKIKSFNHRLRIMANLEKPGTPEDAFGVGGPEGHAAGTGVKLSHSRDERRIQALQRDLNLLKASVEAERQIQRELAKFLSERHSVLASTPSIWPVRGWVTSGFGRRISPFTGKRQHHSGLDISTRRGTPIKAPAAGVVTFVGREGSYGKLLVINHGHGLVTRYGHLHRYKVKVGDKVKRGDIIATVGNSGRSTGPHLHYEVLMSGVPTNPRYYILD